MFDYREVKIVGREMESLAGRDKERMVNHHDDNTEKITQMVKHFRLNQAAKLQNL